MPASCGNCIKMQMASSNPNPDRMVLNLNHGCSHEPVLITLLKGGRGRLQVYININKR